MKTANKRIVNKLFKQFIISLISYVLLIIPIAILLLIRRKAWFSNAADATKLSIAITLAVVFLIAMLNGAFKGLSMRFIVTFTMATLIVLLYLLKSVPGDVTWILICLLLGYTGFTIVHAFSDDAYIDEYKKEKARIDARNDIERDAPRGL